MKTKVGGETINERPFEAKTPTSRPEDSPIVPGFDIEKRKKYLELINTKFKTDKGIVTLVRRAAIISRK